MSRYDIVVVGGGINGCGIARDAAGRGLSVLLAEQGDLAGATSSASTKLIHGGLRYLEYYEFRLVREALEEREVLLAAAPHIVWPLRFVLPHHAGLRPSWMLRLGLFFYDGLGGRKALPPTRTVDLHADPLGAPLQSRYAKAFEYSDCWVEDSRLVVLNAMDAAARGADIRVRTRCTAARRVGARWLATLEDETGRTETVEAAALVNATGPWAGRFLSAALGEGDAAHVRLVQGSHIVVPRLFEHDRAYIFQNSDGRIVFAIPYERDFTLIGTTDQDYEGDLGDIRITEAETAYLCGAVSEYFETPVSPGDVVWSYSGVRPLYDDGTPEAQAATRDYVLSLDVGEGDAAPLLNVFGGKITTYRRLAETALEKLGAVLPAGRGAWTREASLPGGNFPVAGFETLVRELGDAYPFLAPDHLRRLARAYGTRARVLLGDAAGPEELGRRFGSDLTEAEVVYLMDAEWARTAADVVWRRSKLGLRLTPDEVAELETFMEDRARRLASRAA